MNIQQPPCRRQTIEQFLADQLSDEEQTAFEDHLDNCAVCRQCLDELAADGSWWQEARGYLSTIRPVVGRGHRPIPTDRRTARRRRTTPGSLFGLKGYLSPTDDPRMLGRLGGYEIVGIVGRGGMGVVLKAFDAPLNRFVAIKVLGPQLAASGAARQRFAREAQAAAAVVHDHVVAIHAVAEANGLPYLVMQYVRGPSLEERLGKTAPLGRRRDPPHRHADRRGPGGGPRPGAGPPRHQAGQHPAGRRRRAGQDHRLRPGPGGRRRQPDPQRRRSPARRSTCPRSRRRASASITAATCSASAACCTRCAPAGRRSGPTPRWPCCGASRRTVPARSARSTRRFPTGWRRSSESCTPRTRPTASRARPRSPPWSPVSWPTSANRRPCRRRNCRPCRNRCSWTSRTTHRPSLSRSANSRGRADIGGPSRRWSHCSPRPSWAWSCGGRGPWTPAADRKSRRRRSRCRRLAWSRTTAADACRWNRSA